MSCVRTITSSPPDRAGNIFAEIPRLERKQPNTAYDYREYLAGLDRPIIAHELGQWTVFPNLEKENYTGSLQPRYFEIYRESATAPP